jgi:thiol-disulfide isomerase/thioredoxin
MSRPSLTAASLLALFLAAACGGSGTDTPEAGGGETTNVADRPSETTTLKSERSVWIRPEDQPDTLFTADGDIVRDGDDRPLGYRLLGEPLPLVTGELLDGEAFSTADLGGQWTLVDVWGIWCSDCMADAPYAAALARAIDQDPDLAFLSIHTPPSAERASEAYGKFGSVEKYFENKGYSYPTVVDRDASIREALRIDWTPTYLLVAPDLTVEAFTTDLSVAGDQPVKDLLAEIAEIRSQR